MLVDKSYTTVFYFHMVVCRVGGKSLLKVNESISWFLEKSRIRACKLLDSCLGLNRPFKNQRLLVIFQLLYKEGNFISAVFKQFNFRN